MELLKLSEEIISVVDQKKFNISKDVNTYNGIITKIFISFSMKNIEDFNLKARNIFSFSFQSHSGSPVGLLLGEKCDSTIVFKHGDDTIFNVDLKDFKSQELCAFIKEYIENSEKIIELEHKQKIIKNYFSPNETQIEGVSSYTKNIQREYNIDKLIQ